MQRETAPFGSWRSPITADLLTQSTSGVAEPQFDGDNIYWLESRPLERGRNTMVRLNPNGEQVDVLPAPLNARATVNEYGGGSYCVRDGILYFVLYDDQRIYRLDTGAARTVPEPLTPDSRQRFAALTHDPYRDRLIAVCEDHGRDGEPSTYLVSVDLNQPDNPPTPVPIAEGHDFYAAPALSPDGRQLTWLAWDHPNMPWDGCECWVADCQPDGTLHNPRQVAGGPEESIFQPQWSPDGELYLVSDRNNWWNLYQCTEAGLQPVLEYPAEFGMPQWVFGQSTYAFLDVGQILCCYSQGGYWHLGLIDIAQGELTSLDTGLTEISYVRAHQGRGLLVGADSGTTPHLLACDPQGELTTLVAPKHLPIPESSIAAPEAIRFPVTADDSGEGHGFFYPPTNPWFQGPEGQQPPLLVLCHGGPTGAARTSLNLKIQFWTSRGFAVADVNYGGSTGYGRDYRNRLLGQWGVVDVQDAVDCVRHLVNTGRVDGDQVAIRGSSAGGYTVLAALTFHDVFKAGASLYGIGDLETLAADTHKFESRYLDKLVGPYPEQRAIYQARSPINHVEQLNCPVIFLQGLKDKVVPPGQAEAMVAALDQKGLPVAYVTFEDEAHGFRQAPNIRHSLEAELYFYGQVFGFALAEPVTPVPIRNHQPGGGNG